MGAVVRLEVAGNYGLRSVAIEEHYMRASSDDFHLGVAIILPEGFDV